MASLRNNFVHYVDEQIEAILSAPGMWGSHEAVELQLLQLLEFRSVALRPELERRAPRTILDAFQRFLQAEFVDPPPMPLFVLVEEYGRQTEFIPLLRKFILEIVAGMEEEGERIEA